MVIIRDLKMHDTMKQSMLTMICSTIQIASQTRSKPIECALEGRPAEFLRAYEDAAVAPVLAFTSSSSKNESKAQEKSTTRGSLTALSMTESVGILKLGSWSIIFAPC